MQCNQILYLLRVFFYSENIFTATRNTQKSENYFMEMALLEHYHK